MPFKNPACRALITPKQFGGFELSPSAHIWACAEIANVCSAASWVLMVCVAHDYIIGRFPEECQREVYEGDADNLVAGSLAPGGSLERAEGGWRLTGRWMFGSGCDHSPWFIVGAKVANPGPDDNIMRHVMVPRADVELDDTWHTLGMRGTGSKDIVVNGAFVPEHRTVPTFPTFLGLSPRCEGAGLPALGLFGSPGHAVRLRPRNGRRRPEGFRRNDIDAQKPLRRRQGEKSHHAEACGGIRPLKSPRHDVFSTTCAIASTL